MEQDRLLEMDSQSVCLSLTPAGYNREVHGEVEVVESPTAFLIHLHVPIPVPDVYVKCCKLGLRSSILQ